MEGENMTQLIDVQGHQYYVPVYLLNPPTKYYVDSSAKVVKDTTSTGELIKVELRHVYQYHDKFALKIPADSKGSEIKAKFMKKFPKYTIARLFLGGKEIHDTDVLQDVLIFKEFVIQVFAK
jgi:hypothetical protein